MLKASNSVRYRNSSPIHLRVVLPLCKKKKKELKSVYLRVKYIIYYVIQIYPAQSFQVGIVICFSAKVRHRLLISVIKWVGFKREHTELKLHAQ